MEPKGSILCSQEPSTDPYPEPYPSNPLHPFLSLSELGTGKDLDGSSHGHTKILCHNLPGRTKENLENSQDT
jgi:hypothetical protein